MFNRSKSSSFRYLFALTTAANVLFAAPISVPPSLAPGSTYRLVFVTVDTRDGTSGIIGDYDTFVTNQANQTLAALGTSWQVIGSTASVSAFNHIGGNFTTPIYNLNGDLVASGASDLWDGGLQNAIGFDQNGDARATNVLTGTNGGGGAGANPLGSGSTQFINFGLSDFASSSWVTHNQAFAGTPSSFYGISGTLTVPGGTSQVIPEPATGAMGLIGALAVLGLRARTRKSRE